VIVQPPASGDTYSAIPLTGFSDLALDMAHHHVFLAGGGKLDVRTDLGAEVATWSINVQDLDVSPDGSHLVVGVLGAVRVYDTSTLALTATHTVGGTCSPQVATVGTKVWFGCDNQLYVVDLAADTPTPVEMATAGGTISRVAVNPADPSKLLIAFMDWLPAVKIQLLDTTTSPATVVATQTVADDSMGFTFAADGSTVIAHRVSSSGAHPRWSATDLTPLTAFGTDVPAAQALTVSASGYWAGGRDASASATPDARVYDASGALVRTYDFGTTLGRLAPHGLALTSGANRLYAVTYDGNGHYALRVLSSPTKRVSAVTLTAPTAAAIGISYVIKGALTSSSAIPGGQTLTVKRTSSYGTVTRPSVTTASNGTFAISDAVSARGWYTYSVSWAGDVDHTAVSSSVKVYVKGKATSVSVTVSTAHVTYGAYTTVTGHLATATKSRSLSIYAAHVGQSAVRLKTATVDSSGNVRGSWRPSENTYYSARFLGDAVYEPATATRLVYVSPQLTYKVNYHYGMSGATYLFRNTVSPLITVTLHPVRGGCLAATEQQLVSGTWKTVDTNSCLGIYSGDMTTGYCAIHMYDDPRSGTFRVRITFPATKYFAGASLPWIAYRYTT